MSNFSETAGGVGAIASGASSLFGAISSIGAAKRQRNLMDYQYKKEAAYQKDMAAHNWNNYNSPAAQRRSMEAAGINPFAGDSSIAGMQTTSNSTGPDLQEAADPLGGFASNIQAGASSLFQMSEQRRVNDSVIKMNEANANKAQADANQTNMMLPGNLDLQELDKQLKTIAGANDALRNQLLAIEAKYKERQTLLGLQQMQQEIDESLSRVQLNSAEQKVKDKMLEQIDASIRLANAQTSTEGAKQRNLDAGTKLTDAQRETEDQLRDRRSREISQRLDIGNIQKVRELVTAVRELHNRTDISNPYTAIVRLANKIFEQDLSSDRKDLLIQELLNSVFYGDDRAHGSSSGKK